MLLRNGLLAQSAERGANNAKVVSSILTQANLFVQRHKIFKNILENVELVSLDISCYSQNNLDLTITVN